MQECGVGLVELRRDGDALAFRAPDFLRTGPVDEETLGRVIGALGVEAGQLVDAWWIDNGPGWLGLELDSGRIVLSLRPDFAALEVDAGVIGPFDAEERASPWGPTSRCAPSAPAGHQRGPGDGQPERRVRDVADPQRHACPRRTSRARAPSLGRDGRVRISTDDSGDLWVGGTSRTVVQGTVDL